VKLFVLHPGWVTSKNDGDQHYIGPVALCSYYHVILTECLVEEPKTSDGANPLPHPGSPTTGTDPRIRALLMHLRSSVHGMYEPVTLEDRSRVVQKLKDAGVFSLDGHIDFGTAVKQFQVAQQLKGPQQVPYSAEL